MTSWINEGSRWSISVGHWVVNLYPPSAESRGKHYGYIVNDDSFGSGRFFLHADLDMSKVMILEAVHGNAISAANDALAIARHAEDELEMLKELSK